MIAEDAWLVCGRVLGSEIVSPTGWFPGPFPGYAVRDAASRDVSEKRWESVAAVHAEFLPGARLFDCQ